LGKPLAGDVVIVPFPFSDLSQTKRRPALVLVDLEGNDLILCMITSREVRDRYAIPLEADDFWSGMLPVSGNLRPSRIFTADTSIVLRVAGKIKPEKLAIVSTEVAKLLTASIE
jgi:mRNA interferase MazF